MEIYVKISFVSIFSLFFFWFSTISHLQTLQVMMSQISSHRIFNTGLLYSCAHFIVKIDEKFILNDGF